jgi:hypothetical protein
MDRSRQDDLLNVTAQARRKTIRMWCDSTQRHMGVHKDSATLDLCLSTPIGLVQKDIKKLLNYLEARRNSIHLSEAQLTLGNSGVGL